MGTTTIIRALCAAVCAVVVGCSSAPPEPVATTAAQVQLARPAPDLSAAVDRDALVSFLQGEARKEADPVRLELVVMALHLLQAEVPGPDRIASIYLELQRLDGTWPGFSRPPNEHYITHTANYGLLLERLGRTPRHSAAKRTAFLERWDLVRKDIDKHRRTEPENFWGEAIGYVVLHLHLHGRNPPWMPELTALAEADHAHWTQGNHARTRVSQIYALTGLPLPRRDAVLESVRAQQNADGGWGNELAPDVSNLPDTASALLVLSRWGDAEPAVQPGLDYLGRHYQERGGRAAFVGTQPRQGGNTGRSPETSKGRRAAPPSITTAFAVLALVETGVLAGDPHIRHIASRRWSGGSE